MTPDPHNPAAPASRAEWAFALVALALILGAAVLSVWAVAAHMGAVGVGVAIILLSLALFG